MLKKVLIVFLSLGVSTIFFFIQNKINYPVHLYSRDNLIKHPELIPKKEVVKLTSFWFDNLISDFYWLYTIQYIWDNAIWWDYKKYLYSLLDFITDINPQFIYPYKIWELILPPTKWYEKIPEDLQTQNSLQAEKIWLKWIKNTCDLSKIEAIKKETDLKKIWTDTKYKNPCKDYNVPYYLAYIYYWTLNKPLESSLYYKITSANEDAPSWTKWLAAIMQWKAWDRQKSIYMFLNLAETVVYPKSKEKQEICSKNSNELKNFLTPILFDKNYSKYLDSNLLKQVEIFRQEIAKVLEEDKIDYSKWVLEEYCSSYINKATRELNLQYIEEADKKFFEKFKYHAKDPEMLLEKWFIDYIPKDFQITKNKDWKKEGIIYYYDFENNSWSYKMWYED